MNDIAKLGTAVALLLASTGLGAQTFKCTDAAGKITYSGTKCSDLGLKSAGEVKDRINVGPAYRPPAPKTDASAAAPKMATEAKPDTPPADAKPAQPERRCFVVSTPTGKVTRCNDQPQQE